MRGEGRRIEMRMSLHGDFNMLERRRKEEADFLGPLACTGPDICFLCAQVYHLREGVKRRKVMLAEALCCKLLMR